MLEIVIDKLHDGRRLDVAPIFSLCPFYEALPRFWLANS